MQSGEEIWTFSTNLCSQHNLQILVVTLHVIRLSLHDRPPQLTAQFELNPGRLHVRCGSAAEFPLLIMIPPLLRTHISPPRGVSQSRPAYFLFSWLILRSWRWERYAPPLAHKTLHQWFSTFARPQRRGPGTEQWPAGWETLMYTICFWMLFFTGNTNSSRTPLTEVNVAISDLIFSSYIFTVVGWGTMLQAGRSRAQVLMRSLDFFNYPNPSGRTMALGSTQPLTEMNTRYVLGG
jgi:hypothetical protein